MSKPVFKRRPRGFFGVPSKGSPPLTDKPTPLTTSSSKKLALSPVCSASNHSMILRSETLPCSSFSGTNDDDVGNMEGYRLVNCEALLQAVTIVGVCSSCWSRLTVKEDLAARRGLTSKLTICCSNAKCEKKAAVCDPYTPESKLLNTRAVLGMRQIGRGRAGLETFCGLLDMLPPVTPVSYKVHNACIAEATMKVAEANVKAASAHLHHCYGNRPHDLIDATVTCDGTWSKRGFTATYGVVIVISWETGQVLDFEILSKRCTVCSNKLRTMAADSEEFMEWWETHKSNCEKNHFGSSPMMELAGARKIWDRSQEKLSLRFTKVISDGDSKTVIALNDAKPYGEGVEIEKHECIGHIKKRCGTRLRAMKKIPQFDADGKRVKIGGIGRLTSEKIDKLQEYYGLAIKRNTHDLQAMKDAVMAVPYHSVSSDRDPMHEYCPKGPDSWCKYQRAIALLQFDDLPSHTPLLPADLLQFILPTFKVLSKDELLEKCLLGATQNRNESFNNLVWSYSPKTEFVSLDSMKIAVGQAVIVFNSGQQALANVMKRLEVQPGPLCTAYFKNKDKTHLQRSHLKEEEVSKKRRMKTRQTQKAIEEAHIEAEGVTYEPGGF